jgi:hypothetical protein
MLTPVDDDLDGRRRCGGRVLLLANHFLQPPGFVSAALLRFFVEQHPQFPRPVRQRQAQPFQVRMAGPELCFDGRDLLTALAFFPLSVCHLLTTTSTYLGSSSMPRQTRSVSSAAARVVPLPKKGS